MTEQDVVEAVLTGDVTVMAAALLWLVIGFLRR
jgi:hypothetical protein